MAKEAMELDNQLNRLEKINIDFLRDLEWLIKGLLYSHITA